MNENESQAIEATPSRRRGRPPKVIMAPSILAPPQEPVPQAQVVHDPGPFSQQAPTVPSPFSDEIDLREKPELRIPIINLPGSDSKVRGGSEELPHLDAGVVLHIPNPALPGSVLKLADEFEKTWTPIQAGDVVQVNNPENKKYGTLFTVGDVQNHRVHGYQIMAGGKLEYQTVDEQECFRIGPSKVLSRNGCSAKWNAENR